MKYKVKVVMISLKGNKVARSGEIVNRGQLGTDPETLIEGGYIEEYHPGKGEGSQQSELTKMTVDQLHQFIDDNDLDVDLDQNKPGLLADTLKAWNKEEEESEEEEES